jgi:hypothetical protein
MSHRKQHTSYESSLQVSDPATADWQQLVQERLPSSLESQAQALGAFVRVRRIKSASLLLRALLCYVLSLSSLKDLSMWSRLVEVTDVVMSAQAWHKRLRQSLVWRLGLFDELLAAPPPSWSGPTTQRMRQGGWHGGQMPGSQGRVVAAALRLQPGFRGRWPGCA